MTPVLNRSGVWSIRSLSFADISVESPYPMIDKEQECIRILTVEIFLVAHVTNIIVDFG